MSAFSCLLDASVASDEDVAYLRVTPPLLGMLFLISSVVISCADVYSGRGAIKRSLHNSEIIQIFSNFYCRCWVFFTVKHASQCQ